MLTLRKSSERGRAHHGWLESYHSFSFAEYFDPAHMGYSVLRVINEDVVAPSAGFGMHPHRDMEIITYILQGELQHQDSMGNTSVIGVGDVQRMTAGTGVRHSEINPSSENPVHLLQIWILPNETGLPPSYEEKYFPVEQKQNRWVLLASPDRAEQSMLIHQDIRLFASLLDAQRVLDYTLGAERCAYLQIAKGQVMLDGTALQAGDAAMISAQARFAIQAESDAQMLLFDLPVLA